MVKFKYSFGYLEWQGEIYRKDLLILPDGGVLCPWKREQGHYLQLEDLHEVMATHPRVLIIGTGQSGVLEVPDEVLQALADQGLDVEPLPTAKALQRFAEIREAKRTAAALHLTC